VTRDRTLVANFVPAWTISTESAPAAGGTTAGGGAFNDGDRVTVTASANAGYAFVCWTEDAAIVATTADYTFTAAADRLLTAEFVRTFAVTTNASPAAGGTTGGDGVFDEGDSVTVTAAANAGYAFVDWTEGGAVVSASADYTFTAGADRVLTAEFVRMFTVATNASPAAGGTTGGDGVYREGDSVTVTAAANSGYVFLNWTEGAAIVDTTASCTFAAGADRSLTANFVPDTPVLFIGEITATGKHGKLEVTVVFGNSGGGTAQAVSIDSKRDAKIDRKATHERAPIDIGDIAPGGTSTTTLTFSGIKRGVRILDVTLHFAGGTVTLSGDFTAP
jgi:hypothetical protein